MKIRKLPLLSLALFASITAPSTVQASSLGMQLNSSSSTATLCDNNSNFTGCTATATDLNGATGAITFIAAVGTWTSNVTSGFGPPVEDVLPILEFSSFDMTSSGADPLTLLLTVTGLTSPTDLMNWSLSLGGNNSYAGTTVSSQAWLSMTNAAFCTSSGCGVALTGGATGTGSTFGTSANGIAPTGSGPYSLTLEVTLNSNGQANTTTFDGSLNGYTPEPSTFAMLGSGLLGLAVAFRRLRGKSRS